MQFCQECLFLLEEITTTGKLSFHCNKCGEKYDAKAEDTILASEDLGAADSTAKFKHSIRTTAYDPTNPHIKYPCDSCGHQVVSYQLLGDQKKIVYVCLCGSVRFASTK